MNFAVKLHLWMQARIYDKLKERYFLAGVAEHGSDIRLYDADLRAISGLERIHLGSHIYLGPKIRILCTNADVFIDDYVIFGPEVMIVTGNHRTDAVGQYMYEVTEKKPENDQPVHIHKDVWVGARAIILKGSEIGEGSVIAAGAVVSGAVPPYSIYLSKNDIRPRFTDAELKQHREMLNSRKH